MYSKFIQFQKHYKQYYLMNVKTHLATPENDGDHTLGFGSLRALVNENRAELHLGETRVPSSNTRTAYHISSLKTCDLQFKKTLLTYNKKANK